MSRISIICVGKIKEKYWNEAIAEYSKRLGRYVKLDIIEVADEKTPDDAPPALCEQIKKKEADRIFENIDERAKICTLEIKGKSLSSEQLSEFIGKQGVEGINHIQFIIGGSLGLHESVLKKSQMAISFSAMTFPHQMMRVILLEQIYRSYRILNGEPYHK